MKCSKNVYILNHARTTALLLLLFMPIDSVAQAPVEHALPTNPPTTMDVLVPAAQRHLAPDFRLTDNDGKVFVLSSQRGKVVVLNFWATWCGGCKFELPYFVEYDRKYRAQGLVTLGISMDDDGFKVVEPFWKQRRMPYSSVIGDDALAKKLGLNGMPFTLLIDRQGRIAIAHGGVLDQADFDRHIRELLKG